MPCSERVLRTKIFIIEDDVSTQLKLSLILENAGYHVLLAEDNFFAMPLSGFQLNLVGMNPGPESVLSTILPPGQKACA
jgi:CheY-like chemotaxis protein